MRTALQKCGFDAEHNAADYLLQQGLKLVAQNYSCKFGELDLVMQDGEYLVFIEVRYRKLSGYGDGVESVTKSKQSKIIRAAKCYLFEHNLYDKVPCRFDVVAAAPDAGQKLVWIKDAFWLK